MAEQLNDAPPASAVPEILSEKELCKVLGISTVTAWRLRKAHKLGFCTYAGKIVYLPKHVAEFLSRSEVTAAGSREPVEPLRLVQEAGSIRRDG